MADGNLVLITLDSLRLDVAQSASMPSLRGFEGPVAAYTHGNFTLAAHAAFFTGHLPVPLDPSHRFFGRYFRLVRPRNARRAAGDVAMIFAGADLMDAYRSENRTCWGAGGVPYFDPEARPTLAAGFSEWRYRGYSAESDYTASRSRTVEEARDHCPLHDLEESLRQRGPNPIGGFFFCNVPATHYPYLVHDMPLTARDREQLTRIDMWIRSKALVPDDESRDLLAWGPQRQGRALEALNPCLEGVVSAVESCAAPSVVIITSDHGEAFGEGHRMGHFVNEQPVLDVPIWTRAIGHNFLQQN